MGGVGVTGGSATDGDYGLQGHTVRANNRNTTKQPVEFGGVQSMIGAVIAPLLDVLRPSRKEKCCRKILDQKVMYNNLVSGEYVINPGDRPKTTIKEMIGW